MKSSLFLFILLSLSVKGFPQKLKVLLIGASHDYSKSVPQDLKGIHKQIREFKPTAFFGEFVSPDDEERLMDYWCKADNTKRLERLKANRNINAEDLANTITSLRSNLHLDQQNGYLKADLAHAYYLSQDVANGHYLYWQVYNSLKQHPDSDLQAYVDSLLSPKLDISGRSMKRLINSEYALIAFPMMRELKIEKLLSMDCQDYDLNWTASAIAFHEAFDGFQKDTLAKDTKSINATLKKRENGFKQYATNESTSQHFTEWLNTDEASSILASGDFYRY